MAYLSLPILIMDINGFMFWSPPIIFALLISCDWCHTTSYNLPLLTKPHLWQIGSPYLTTFPWFWPWVGLPYLTFPPELAYRFLAYLCIWTGLPFLIWSGLPLFSLPYFIKTGLPIHGLPLLSLTYCFFWIDLCLPFLFN